METNHTLWAHAPEHRLSEKGTYQKKHSLNTPKKLIIVRNLPFELALKYDWQLQAWSIMPNHYHIVASSPDDPATLKKILSTLHTLSGKELNRIDQKPKRRA